VASATPLVRLSVVSRGLPIGLLTLAFRSLSDRTCFLHILFRVESRFERQYLSALKTVNKYRAEGAADRIHEKVNMNERTQQPIENTRPHSDQPPEIAVLQTTAAARN
jgi:hypothetical protein